MWTLVICHLFLLCAVSLLQLPPFLLITSPSSMSLQFISFYPNADFLQDAANVFRFLLFFHSLILFSLCVGKFAHPGVGGGCY